MNLDYKKINSERTPEERHANTTKAGKASGKARAEKKLMSQIYAEFLAKTHNINIDGKMQKMTGSELIGKVMSKIIATGKPSAISLMREIREATEGNKLVVDESMKIEWPLELKGELEK